MTCPFISLTGRLGERTAGRRDVATCPTLTNNDSLNANLFELHVASSLAPIFDHSKHLTSFNPINRSYLVIGSVFSICVGTQFTRAPVLYHEHFGMKRTANEVLGSERNVSSVRRDHWPRSVNVRRRKPLCSPRFVDDPDFARIACGRDASFFCINVFDGRAFGSSDCIERNCAVIRLASLFTDLGCFKMSSVFKFESRSVRFHLFHKPHLLLLIGCPNVYQNRVTCMSLERG